MKTWQIENQMVKDTEVRINQDHTQSPQPMKKSACVSRLFRYKQHKDHFKKFKDALF